jgi:energy-coupling factor transporter transmembrane protein EcfT
VSPAPAALLLAGLAAAALLANRIVSVAAIAAVLLVVCLRAPAGRRRLYLVGALGSGLAVFVVTPFVSQIGYHVLWSGPTIPVFGTLDVTREELRIGLFQGLRLTAVALAFAAYALLLDHDRLVQAAGFARRSVLAVALATRLVPTLERDASGLSEALRGRGVEVTGVRGRATLLAPLLAGSLERALNLAEAMEARGYGGATRTRTPQPGLNGPERLLTAIGIVTCAVVAAAIPLDDYSYYDLLGNPFTTVGLATTALVLVAGAAGVATLRWARRPL